MKPSTGRDGTPQAIASTPAGTPREPCSAHHRVLGGTTAPTSDHQAPLTTQQEPDMTNNSPVSGPFWRCNPVPGGAKLLQMYQGPALRWMSLKTKDIRIR
jgi:hypothetical protein